MSRADLRPPTSAARRPPWPVVALAVVTLLGLSMRLWQTRESLWIDELHTAWCALGSLDEVAPRAAMGNQSPLFFWLEWLLVRIFGASELILRMPSVVAGSLLPVAVSWLVNRWTKSAWLGVLAAALVVVDHLSIFYATEARPYALIELLAVLHIGLVAELAARPNLRLRMGFVLGAALLFYLHYTTALVIVAEVVFLTLAAFQSLSPRERVAAAGSRVRVYTLPTLAFDLFVLALILFPAIPNLLAIYARRDNWAAFVEQRSVWTVFWLLPWSASVLVVIAGVVIYRWLPKRSRESFAASDASNGESVDRKKLPTPFGLPPAEMLLAVVWLLVPLSLAWATTATDTARLFFPRYLMAAAPAAFVLTAFCFLFLPWRRVQISLAVGLLLYATYSSQIVQQFRYDGRIIGDRQEDWRGAVAWLNEQLPKNDYPVLLHSGLIELDRRSGSHDTRLESYGIFPLTALYRVSADSAEIKLLFSSVSMPDEVEPMIRAHGGVWIVDRGGLLAALLNERAFRRPRRHALSNIDEQADFGNVHIVLIVTEHKVPSTQY